MAAVVTFDAGQTLVELDLDFLARRLAARDVRVDASALARAAPAAWRLYDELVAAGHGHPWKQLMASLLEGAGVADVRPHVDWLWDEQPRVNLWRRPIAPMVDLARELGARGVTVAVLSNSEGGLADLFAEIGLAPLFVTIVDSGRVGIEKPDPRIFAHALEVVGGRASEAVHIGDSWSADVIGARDAGWRAIYYPSRAATPPPFDDPRIRVARTAAEARAALSDFGV
jgi:putative hydrolase of the HAD superfamily